MAVFESIGETAEGAVDSAKVYAKATESYIKLQIFKHVAVLLTFIVKTLLIGGMLLGALLYFSVSLTMLISDWVGGIIPACAIVGGLFLVLLIVIFLNSKFIDKKVLAVLSKMFRNESV
jgi:hypothetical protein